MQPVSAADNTAKKYCIANGLYSTDFEAVRLRFTFAAQDDLIMPVHRHAVLRKTLAFSMKRIACVFKRQRCEDCALKKSCTYAYLFETPQPEDQPVCKNHTAVPQPFVMYPEDDQKRTYRAEETLSVMLSLFGSAGKYLPYFLYAFEQLGRRGIGKGRGRFSLRQVAVADSQTVLYDGSDSVSPVMPHMETWKELSSDAAYRINRRLTLRFMTPTRIKHKGAFVSVPDFPVLIKALQRRISDLSVYHCSRPFECDVRTLMDKAGQVHVFRKSLVWKRWGFSDKNRSRMKLEGFVGEIIFEGDLSPFVSLIVLGTLTHVGKGASFGMGRYEIVD